MRVTAITEPLTVVEFEPITIPDRIRKPATTLIGALASRAGDLDSVFEEFDKAMTQTPPGDRTAVIAAALLITFSECITDPTDNQNNPVPVDWTATTTEGETE